MTPTPTSTPVREVPRLAGVDVRRWTARHPRIVDLTIATCVASAALVFEAVDAGEVGASLDAIDIVVCILTIALVVLRRRAPLPVLVVALAAGVGSLIPDDDQGVLRVATFLALYTVASTSTRAIAWAAGGVTAGTLFLAAAITSPGPWYDGDNLELIAWTGIATALGDALRSRRESIVAREERAAALHERAERAEQALEAEGKRQVVEERLRIARELHDVVAHHIAVINVQAGVATHLLRDDPDGAEQALAHVRNGASSVLDELSNILSVMRQPDASNTLTEPLPTLEQLDRLIAQFTAAGLDVEWQTVGSPKPVAPAVSLAAYRIVQESLTNAHRHGKSPHAELRVQYRPNLICIEVLNDITDDRPTTGRLGHGLVGMRERVAAAGGTIELGPTKAGRFRVHAVLPAIGDNP